MKEELYMMLFKKKRDDEIKGILKCNEISREYGLELSEEEVEILVKKRYEVLRELKRRDYGNWIIDQIIREFCKSEFITKDNYAQTIGELMYRFYYYKNETKNLIPDGELLKFMHKFFDGVCKGSMQHLSEDVLDKMVKNVLEGKQMDYGIDKGNGINIDE